MRYARVRRPTWALAAVLTTAVAVVAHLGATTIARRAPSASPTSRAHEAPLTVHDQGGGPAGGTVSSLVALATTPPTLVAAFEHGGVLRTSDRGRTWTPIDRGLPDDASCELTAPAASVSELYAECGGDLFKTGNRGASWRLLDLHDAVAPAIAPSDSRLLYELPFLTARSVDGGRRWSDVQSDWNTRAVAIDPANALRLYRLTDDELETSVNGGATWRRVARSPAANVDHLVIDPADSRVMFAASGDGTLFKTTSRGTLWFRAGDGLASGSIDRLQFSGALMLALQDGALLHSDDAGEHWVAMSRPAGDEVRSFAVNAAAPSTVFAATASGLFVTDDLGRRWVRLRDSVNRAVTSVAVHDATTSTLMAATGRGLYASTDAGATWQTVTAAGRLDPLTVRLLTPDGSGGAVAHTTSGAFVLRRNDTAWIPVDQSRPPTANGIPLGQTSISRSLPRVAYAGSRHLALWPGEVFRTADGGSSWLPLGPCDSYINASCVPVVDPHDPDTVYVQVGGVVITGETLIRISRDAGVTWKAAAVRAGQAFTVLPTTPTTLLLQIASDSASGGYQLLASTDGGERWTPTGRGLPANVALTGIVADPRTPRRLFTGTQGRGVFKSDDGGATWTPTGPVSR